MSVKYHIFIVILFLLVLVSCTSRPDDILHRSEMQKVLIDLHKADGIISVAGYSYGHEEQKSKYYESVLAEYGVTQAQFDSSLVWYSANPQIFEKIYLKVTGQLQAEYDLLTENTKPAERLDTILVRPAILDSLLPAILREKTRPQYQFMQMLLGTDFAEMYINKIFPKRCIYLPELQDSIFTTLANDTVSIQNSQITFTVQPSFSTRNPVSPNNKRVIEMQDVR